jgi:hypothetical protein
MRPPLNAASDGSRPTASPYCQHSAMGGNTLRYPSQDIGEAADARDAAHGDSCLTSVVVRKC